MKLRPRRVSCPARGHLTLEPPRRSSRSEPRARRTRARAAWPAPLVAFFALSALAVSPAAAAPALAAGQPAPLEYQVKAAFVYNFAKFVEWPDDAERAAPPPIVIGVLGDDRFGSVLDKAMSGKTVGGRVLVVKRFADRADVEPCHILFIGEASARGLTEVLDRLGRAPVLTIGESARFARDGGILRFVTEDSHIRFEINVDAAARAGVRISSKLLALAHVVRDADGGER